MRHFTPNIETILLLLLQRDENVYMTENAQKDNKMSMYRKESFEKVNSLVIDEWMYIG